MSYGFRAGEKSFRGPCKVRSGCDEEVEVYGGADPDRAEAGGDGAAGKRCWPANGC